MGKTEIRFLGSGDAFGSGGRLQACIDISSPGGRFLLDCGASSCPAMRRFNVEPNDIGMILVSHLHGDHFGGIPFFILDAQLVSKRERELIIAGPRGIEQRVRDAMEVFFPGSSTVQRKFPVTFRELEPDVPVELAGAGIAVFPVEHPSGAPSLALRISLDGKTVAYTGDTEWTDSLIPACRDADLLIAEAYFYEKKVRFHLDYGTLKERTNTLGVKRLVVTHLGQDALRRADEMECEVAEDGKVLQL